MKTSILFTTSLSFLFLSCKPYDRKIVTNFSINNHKKINSFESHICFKPYKNETEGGISSPEFLRDVQASYNNIKLIERSNNYFFETNTPILEGTLSMLFDDITYHNYLKSDSITFSTIDTISINGDTNTFKWQGYSLEKEQVLLSLISNNNETTIGYGDHTKQLHITYNLQPYIGTSVLLRVKRKKTTYPHLMSTPDNKGQINVNYYCDKYFYIKN